MSSGIPFAPLSLTLDQHQHCQDIAFQLLDRTLRNYDERNDSKDPHTGLPRHHSNLDSVNWKRLRTRANTSLYSERTSSLPRGHHFPLHDGSWNNPCALLAVGTIDSTLDEVMFGLETPDFLTMQVRSAMLGKQSVDGAILSRLAGPTDTDPFQFMGITWMAEKQGWPLSMVIRPRDFTIISATGVVRRPNGDRIGYEVAQSIDLPQCPPLPAPMVRGKLMYGAVYKQLDNGTVDVYINMYVESQGRVLNKLVAAAMWESALGFWKAPQLSETKKLQWCMENKSDTRQKRAAVTHDDSDVKATHCEVCSKKRNLQSRRHSTQHYNDRTACSLCATPVCSICRIKRTVNVPSETSENLLHISVSVCRVCMLFVRRQCPSTIAKLNEQQRRETDSRSSHRLTFESVWDHAVFSPLSSRTRYPSISVSDLVKLINRFADLDVPDAKRSLRRKTDPTKA